MEKHALNIVYVMLPFFIVGCSKDIVDPTNDVKPGSRNYTWTVDTVYAPYNPFFSLSGTSPTDLWTASPGDGDKIFYHYDGIKWSTDGIGRSFSPATIFSLNSNDVWSAGVQGKIWHFDGNNWSEHYKYSLGGDTLVVFQDIYALSETDIYAAGQFFISPQDYWGIILHYDGNSWNRINISKIRTSFSKIRSGIDGKIYLSGVTNEQYSESTYQLYEFDGRTLTQVRSGTQANDQLGNILELGDQVLFIIGFDFYGYINSSFVKVGRLSDLPEFLNVGFGRSTKDIFLGMRNGIAHYNGENTEYLVKVENNVFVRYGKVFEKDVFLMGRDLNGNNLIYHGKLNE